MALNPRTRYPAQTVTDGDYTYGKARNITVAGDGTGTPWEADIVNDWFGFFQALLNAGDVVPGGTPDSASASQYLTALRQLNDRTISPAAISSSQNNWAPTDYETAAILRVQNDTVNAGLTGLSAASLERTTKIVVNVGSNAFPLFNASGSSTDGNRFLCPDGTDLYLRAGQAAMLLYDATSANWRVFATPPDSSTINTATLSAQQDDYNPTGIDVATVVRVSLSANVTITGIDASLGGSRSGRSEKIISNASAYNLTLAHQDAASSGANRFLCPNSVDAVVYPGEAAWIVYDATSAGWVVRPMIGYSITGEFVYAAAKTRTKFVDLARGHQSANVAGSWDYIADQSGTGYDYWLNDATTVATGDKLIFPITLPAGAVITQLDAQVYHDVSVGSIGTGTALRLRRVTPQVSGLSGIQSDEVVSTTGTGYKALSLAAFSNMPSAADRTVVPANKTYSVIIEAEDVSGGASVRLDWLKVTYTDPGPINDSQ